MKPPPRNRASRIEDTLRRLEQDIDAWVATSSPEGGPPGLVPLSFHWDDSLRDVVMIDATVRELPMEQVSDERGSAFERRVKWDPRASGPEYAAYLFRPVRVQAWRESNELAGRTLMREGRWLPVEEVMDA